MEEMKTLTLGDTIYEIVDDSSRVNIENINRTINTINENISIINKNITNIENKSNETSNNLSSSNEYIENLSNELNNVVKNPDVGTIGQVLAIETLDENGKPLTYKAVDNYKKTIYQHVKECGYVGSEEEFYQKLIIENPTKEEFNELIAQVELLKTKVNALSETNSETETEIESV